MSLRNAIPIFLAGLLIPAAWGLSQSVPQDPPAQQPLAQAPQQPTRPHRHPGGFTGWANGASGGTGNPMFRRSGPGGPPAGGLPPGAGRHGFPPMFDKLAAMSPEERNKALESDPRFLRLSPERQAQMRAHVERYAAMTPQQRQQMRDRFDIVNSMPPENRDRIREIFPRWKRLPPDRQQAMREEFHSLSTMSQADREKRFADPEFQKAFNPREQQLLKDLAGSIR
jgi:hypothetical protein